MALDNRQWSPLHYGSYNGHPGAVNTLLKWEADFDKLSSIKNSQGREHKMFTIDHEVSARKIVKMSPI